MWDKDITQLVNQESFLNYCFKRNDADVRYWENWLKENPEYGNQVEELRKMLVLMAEKSQDKIKDRHFAQLKQKIDQSRCPSRRYPYFLWNSLTKTAAAAILFIGLSFGLYFYVSNYIGPNNQHQTTNNDIEPGSNRAILTLADGRKIALDEAADGELAEESGIKITKTEDGQVVYEVTDARITDARQPMAGSAGVTATYNTITTPRGGQYKVILPDSSVVWLNAASSLRYPTRFIGAERRVDLSGEAYFEIIHKAVETHNNASLQNIKFIVATTTQEVTVLGTHFNINAYEDEPVVKTTLLEGSVRVASLSPSGEPVPSLREGRDGQSDGRGRNEIILVPNQQSTLLGKSLAVVAADTEEAIAWKNGMFVFNDESLESLMRKVARWYDVKIVYTEGVDKNELYGGSFSRYDNVSSVLRKLELTGGIHFKIEAKSNQQPERRIVVMR